jgi:hypothetical protein
MLTNLQLELLKTFSRPIPQKQILEIKDLLADYFAKKVDEGLDNLIEEQNWQVSDKVEEWKKSHSRTPYVKPS